MGRIYADIRLGNPANPKPDELEISALVDTGAVHLCIPEHVALQLQLRELEQREVVTADGRRQLCAYVGPVSVEFHGRHCYTGAEIDMAMQRLNNRPRKRLGYLSPNQVLSKNGVALQT